jgi:hypothetical protein
MRCPVLLCQAGGSIGSVSQASVQNGVSPYVNMCLWKHAVHTLIICNSLIGPVWKAGDFVDGKYILTHSLIMHFQDFRSDKWKMYKPVASGVAWGFFLSK